jgi:hypothetical protein
VAGLTGGEVAKVIYKYIGVSGGYLGDFSYRTHAEFYPLFCDLEIDPYEHEGTTRERFMEILKSQTPRDQAKILRGVLERFPVGADGAPDTRNEASKREIETIIARLEQNAPVTSLSPSITSDAVVQAIVDAENLLATSGAASAVDRVHTALHGYLREACSRAAITFAKKDSIMRLMKLLHQQHPSLSLSTDNEDAERILYSFGTIMDALNKMRNHASLAHPNPSLLDNADAILAINATRTILHYLDGKL